MVNKKGYFFYFSIKFKCFLLCFIVCLLILYGSLYCFIYINNNLIINYSDLLPSLSTDTGNNAVVSLDKTVLTPIRVEYIKTFGSNTIQLFWQSDSIPTKTPISSNNLYNTLYSTSTPILMTVNASVSDPSTLKFSDNTYVNCIAGVEKTAVLQIYDKYSNLQTHNLDVISATLNNTVNSTLTNAIITPLSPGLFNLKYTLNFVGIYNLLVNVTPYTSSLQTSLDNFNQITCSVNTVDPTKTNVNGSGLTASIAGLKANFTIQLFDTNSNLKTTIGDTVIVTIISNLEKISLINIGFQNKSSNYLVEYIATKSAAPYNITILINGNTVKTSTMICSANFPSFKTSSFSNLITSYNMNVKNTFSVNLYDIYQNTITTNYPLYASFKGNFGSYNINGNLKSGNTYNITFQINSLGTVTTGCGSTYISIFPIINGITASYFNNYWLNGIPISTGTESLISYNWGIGVNPLNNLDKKYTSIKWTGYFIAGYSQQYTFYITSNNNVRFYIENSLLIDSFSLTVLPPIYSVEVNLVQNNIYSFNLMLFIAEDQASVMLEWQGTSQSRQIIPSTNFYTKVFLFFK